MANARPKWTPAQITGKGVDALALAEEDRALLEPRLPAGIIDGARADLAGLGAAVAAPIAKRAETRASTATQNQKAQRVVDYVSAFRTAVNGSRLSAAAKKRYGVGLRMTVSSLKTVNAAATRMLEASAEAPDEVRELGITPEDLEALRAALAELGGADQAQEHLKGASKTTTAARNATLRRLEEAIRRIATAGVLAHVGNAARRAQYEALLAGPSKGKGGGPPTPPA